MASQLDGLFICAAILFVVCQKVEGSESSNCNDLQQVANGALSSGTYSVTNSNGQDFTIYCQFHSEYGYTFVSKNTNVDIDMTSLYDDATHVIVRHKRSNGNQYTAKMEQLSSHSNVPISVQYNSSTGYGTPRNAAMTPYIFVGFIPANMTYKGAKEGWKCNGQDYKFRNCDANPNSYFVFLFNHGSVSYTSKPSVYNALLFNWYDKSSSVTPSEYLPDEFFTSYYEIHHGGCGGYAQSEAVSDINGVTVGLKFVTKCATPKDIHSGTKSYTGTSVGSTLTYSCDSGLVVLSGDSTRTCNASGGWSGTEPVCGDFDECASNPCQNGATCHNNLYNYTCACATGWQGANCDIDIDECLPHPCENGGTCIDAINDYTCECLPGYTDKNCSTDIDECRSGPCNNGGTCINAINDYTCECLPGYTDKNCSTNIDECLPHPCENGGTCIDAINDYTCECLPGYTDKNCSTDIDECRSGPCNNGGTCINAINEYTCECLPGYTDKHCSTNIDECLPHPCENGGTCIDAINDYTCECLPGYTDKNCSTDIDECRSGPCNNGGTCINAINEYTCECLPGYTDKHCSTNIDECLPHPCENGGTCIDAINDYTCECLPGYTDKNCSTDIDECRSGPCNNGGTCINAINEYTCECLPGYTDKHCSTNIDECLPHPCENGGTCIDAINDYTCECLPGYTDKNCSTDIDECRSGPCNNGGTCINAINEYTCECLPGYTDKHCSTNIDECLPHPCENGGTCIDAINDYTCECLPGYTDKNCSTDIDECRSGPCNNGGTCINAINEYTCECLPGYTDKHCSTNIDECLPHPCENGGTCIDAINDYTCECLPGYTDKNCSTDIDECRSGPCNNGGTCINAINEYTCACLPGYTDKNCSTNIDECLPHPCENGGTCIDAINDYTCECLPGYTDKNCSTADVQFVCYPNETIDVYYLPPRANCYAMQNTTLGADIQCNITRVNERTVRMTECSKDLPILLSYGMYNHMERYQVHAGDSLTVVTIMCSEITEVGVNHAISNSLAARLELDGELNYDTTYVITSSLNTTSAVVGDPVAWTISFPVEYILEVTNCTAFPGSTDPSSLFIPLISSGGCNMDEILISNFVDNMDGNATAVIKAFKFYGVESVYLQCIVTVCRHDTTECNTACSREKGSVKEKRSEEAGSRSLKSSIQSILYVVDGSSSAPTITFPALFGFQIVWNVLLLAVIKLYRI